MFHHQVDTIQQFLFNTRPTLDGQIAQLVEQRIENPRVGGSIPSLATIYTSNFIPIVLISAKFLVAAMECGRPCGRPLDHLTTHSLSVVCITSHDVYLKTYNTIIKDPE